MLNFGTQHFVATLDSSYIEVLHLNGFNHGSFESYKENTHHSSFIMNCTLLFVLQPRMFSTKLAKVAFTINHLTRRLCGTAKWECQSPACQDFWAFATELCKHSD